MTGPGVPLLESFAALLDYPATDIQGPLSACLADPAIDPRALVDLQRFAAWTQTMSKTDLQEAYAATFDFSETCSLDVGWHLVGNTHERGLFMAALREDLSRAGVPQGVELPDHLTTMLVLLSRDPDGAPALAQCVVPALEAIVRGLTECDSPYASLLSALRAQLAGLAMAQQQEVSHS